MTQINLEDTVAFVEAREIGRRDVQLLGGGPSSSQVNAVLVQGRCWRRKATVAEHRHMSGRPPAKHSTEPARSAARLAITPRQGCIIYQIRPGFRVERYQRLSGKMWKLIQRPRTINCIF